VVSRKGFAYFALSCLEGGLFLGQFSDELKNTEIKKVRDYPSVAHGARRAMHLDIKRSLLYLFMTDMEIGTLTDSFKGDKETWDDGKKISDTPDEIPDDLQLTEANSRGLLNNTHRFQFMVYDIGAELQNGAKSVKDFRYQEFKAVRKTEPRWLYFNLDNFGDPDDAVSQGNLDLKYYRTNFWEAKPDPDNLDVFYLSHRGLGQVDRSEHANDIIKVTVGEPRVDPTTQVALILPKYMTFQRVYGFKGDQTGADKYFNSFIITKMSGRKVVLLNSFRDPANFKNPRYTLAGAELVEDERRGEWATQLSSYESDQSYYDLALAKNGTVMASISFYNESIELFNVEFGKTISHFKTIE
jgi:hypothetical protein